MLSMMGINKWVGDPPAPEVWELVYFHFDKEGSFLHVLPPLREVGFLGPHR